jgi:hypothetical protein
MAPVMIVHISIFLAPNLPIMIPARGPSKPISMPRRETAPDTAALVHSRRSQIVGRNTESEYVRVPV